MRGKRGRLVGGAVLLLALAAAAVLFLRAKGRPEVMRLGVFAGNYWGAPSGDSYQIVDDAIARFEEEHPGVRVEYVSGISAEDYSEWLAGELLKGTEPDVCFVLPEDFYLLVSSGALLRLERQIAEDESFDVSQYYDACLESGQSGGVQYALPYESVPTVMFVNKTLLETCGIPMPENDWTWEDFYDICERVSRRSDEKTRRFGMYDYNWKYALFSNGAELFSDEGTTCHLADRRVQSAIQFQKRLDELDGGYQVTVKDFDLGNVAFRPFLFSDYRTYQPYPWRVKKYAGFEWDCIPMPAGPEGGNVSELHTMLLGIGARSPRKELAWEFVKLLSGDEAIQKELYLYSQGISPVRRVAENEETLAALFADTPEGSGMSSQVIGEIMRTAVQVDRFNHYDLAMDMAERAVTEALSGDQTLESRLLTAQREINIYLNRD